MPAAEIITIGTELLLGEKTDTNTTHIARTLRNIGVDVYRTSTIGDNVERIADAIREALKRADIIITTGGLGPTVDDPTREAVARAVGVQTEFRPELWEQITARIARYGRKPSENQRRQAYIPQGAIALENPVGTAPAFIVEQGQKCVISLPGVPREMETLLDEQVVPYLRHRYDLRQVIAVRVLHVAGIGEGDIDARIADLETLSNPTVGLAAHSGIVDVRIAAKAESSAAAKDLIAPVEAEIRQRLGIAIFGSDEETLEGVTYHLLARLGWQLVWLSKGLAAEETDRLRTQNPGLLLALEEDETLSPENLAERLQALQSQHQTRAAVGVHLVSTVGQSSMHTVIITPQGTLEKSRTYGGHPRNAQRWAYHLALNWLRRQALEAQETA